MHVLETEWNWFENTEMCSLGFEVQNERGNVSFSFCPFLSSFFLPFCFYPVYARVVLCASTPCICVLNNTGLLESPRSARTIFRVGDGTNTWTVWDIIGGNRERLFSWFIPFIFTRATRDRHFFDTVRSERHQLCGDTKRVLWGANKYGIGGRSEGRTLHTSGFCWVCSGHRRKVTQKWTKSIHTDVVDVMFYVYRRNFCCRINSSCAPRLVGWNWKGSINLTPQFWRVFLPRVP